MSTVGPWLAHAREHADEGESTLWHAAVDFTGQGKVQAMLGVAGVLRCGTRNPRFAYLPIDRSYPGAVAFATAIGAEHLAELDVEIGGMLVECYRLDYGPGGLFAFLRSQVYSELGLTAPEPSTLRPAAAGHTGLGRISPNLIGASRIATTPAPLITSSGLPRPPSNTGGHPATPQAVPGRPVDDTATTVPALPVKPGVPQPVADLMTVREALKNFRVPRDLARSPLAVGDTVAERAESVRRLINETARDAFGDNENEKLLYSVLVAGYLEPMRSHEEAANKLCLSRAAYFRRLRTSVERLAEHLSEQLSINAAK